MNSKVGLLRSFEITLEERQARSGRRKLSITPDSSVDFSSNDFLSLSRSQQLRKNYLAELEKTNDIPLGSGGSRLLDGNSRYAEQLESDIARFHNAQSGLLFNSGYDANSALFSCIPQEGDIVVYDEYIHASVHEGMRLSRTKTCVSFSHNSIHHLTSTLEAIILENDQVKEGVRNVFVAVESVYSMDGDIAPLKDIVETVESLLPLKNGHVIVDEAHSTGVYGFQGRGIVSDLGLENRVLARLHTFGKALSSGGAIVLCAPIMREYLINYARSLIYSTAMGYPTLILISTVYRFMQDGATFEAQTHIWSLINYFHERLHTLPRTSKLRIPEKSPKSPIFSIVTPYPRNLAKYCQDNGFMVRPIVPPTVPEGGQRVRVCLHSANTKTEIDAFIKVIGIWINNLEISTSSSMKSMLAPSRL